MKGTSGLIQESNAFQVKVITVDLHLLVLGLERYETQKLILV